MAEIASSQNSLTLKPDEIPHVRLDGPLKRLRTLAEVQASDETIEVYIAECAPKSTKVVLDAMKPLLPEDHKKINLAHLRRPCTCIQLPPPLQPRFCPPGFLETLVSSRRKKGGAKTIFVLLCATCLVEEKPLMDSIEISLHDAEHPPGKLHRIQVPRFAPTSPEQAEKWSLMYWPTSFKNNNPYGPHPRIIALAEIELTEERELNAEAGMKLARRAAADGKECGLGAAVGVCVIERSPEYGARVVAVASDGRYRGTAGCHDDEQCGGRGNILAHAVMRAIALVALKRRIIDGKAGPPANPLMHATHMNAVNPPSTDAPSATIVMDQTDSHSDEESPTSPVSMSAALEPPVRTVPAKEFPPMPSSCLDLLPHMDSSSNIFLDYPITDMEKEYFDKPTLAPKGYLALQLELYVTHEPCIMCSMALLHSRFGRVIFEKEMRSTGALIAERPPMPSILPILIPREQGPAPTKSAKRRRNRKNSKMRARAIVEAEKARPLGPPIEYGLWWRGQLNWKFLCWQWRQDRVGFPDSRPSSSNMSTTGAGTPSIEWAPLDRGGPDPRSSMSDSRPSMEDDLIDRIRSMTLDNLDQYTHV
ncbi:hypothetical protein BT63DRAFT_422781 [Microthyrium microscopicum]|uniref:Uncharacterized protein n=1 Tax=Microthyrium microscopicum TaxID=703497 RepID=A0A6A6UN08_9PEZI|nr:hypothetical protein BT63DRAFT_422781 [Microthyrium microscopicum]